ncbi:MAG: hypothetical protein NDF52_07985 [archaeon YNP-WB-062]|nr:hypothetical protein [Candidatus Culexarchaeum yellowstonense]
MKVKLESRIVGVVFRRPLIVSSVFRGSLRLDGIIIGISQSSNPLIEAIDMIMNSKFFDEISFIVIDAEGFGDVDVDYAFSVSSKPVIVVYGGSMVYRGLSDSDFKRLMGVACIRGGFEALRVSRLIALKLLGTLSNYFPRLME